MSISFLALVRVNWAQIFRYPETCNKGVITTRDNRDTVALHNVCFVRFPPSLHPQLVGPPFHKSLTHRQQVRLRHTFFLCSIPPQYVLFAFRCLLCGRPPDRPRLALGSLSPRTPVLLGNHIRSPGRALVS